MQSSALSRLGAVAAGVAILAIASPAVAQAPAQAPIAPAAPAQAPVAAASGPAEPVLAPGLEPRLTEELAGLGVALSRRNLGLLIEPRPHQWSVSLIDLATGRPAATIRIDPPPADPGKALALLLGVVDGLERQVIGPVAPVAPRPPVSDEQRAELDHRRAAEVAFLRQELRFRPTFDAQVPPDDGGGRWRVYRGGADQELDAPEFYHAIGRDDLADSYRLRERLMIGGFVAGTVAFIVAGVLNIRTDDISPCNGMPPGVFDSCVHDHMRSKAPTVIAAGIGLGAALFGTYFYRRPHPIDENDAKGLADAYNQRLRHQLGQPPLAQRTRLLHDVAVAPYVAGRDGGLVIRARF